VDQFEELFTLHDEETQRRFVELLGRASESGVHVLLSMRDDFLIRCHAHPALEPVFKDLTPIVALEGPALRRALTEPARASGYRFENESLVVEILTEVTRERGALPLLAFAASKLWEKRDREGRRLTREAYLSIGGVAGALAQHAEETLAEIGAESEPLVREIFRNLTTASGTRIPFARKELLSVFADAQGAERVLSKLIDARLLTSAGDEVEVIHESLLSAWPRLVRWQAQDAEGAVLRDQLRQAARVWDVRERADDFLWTGAALRDFTIWRERYPGRLSATEEAFARAAENLADRRRRRTRLVFGSILVASLTVACVMLLLWRRSELETLRAEASKLVVLGQLERERHPAGAVAYALKSLELADTEEARRFALPLLTNSPIARQTLDLRDGLESLTLAFSSNGEWVAVGGYRSIQLRHQDGREPIVLEGEYPTDALHPPEMGFAPNDRLLASNRRGDLRLWSVPEGREVRRELLEEGPSRLFVRGNSIFVSTTAGARQILRRTAFDRFESTLVGSMEALRVFGDGHAGGELDVSRSGTEVAYALGGRVYLRPLGDWSALPALVAEHGSDVLGVAFHPDGSRLAVSDDSGEIRIWSLTAGAGGPLRVLRAEKASDTLSFSSSGDWLAAAGQAEGLWVVRLWNLRWPPGTRPLELRTGANSWLSLAFDPAERWLVTSHAQTLAFWPLRDVYPRVLEETRVFDVRFLPGATSLLSSSTDRLHVWPLESASGSEPRVLRRTLASFPLIDLDASGRTVVAPSTRGEILVLSVDGGPARELEGFSEDVNVSAVAISPDGSRVAAASYVSSAEKKGIKVWDLERGSAPKDLAVPDAGEGEEGAILNLFFVDRHRLLASGLSGLLLFDLEDSSRQELLRSVVTCFAFSRTAGLGVAGTLNSIARFTLEEGASSPVPYPDITYDIALNPEATLVATGGLDGIVRVMSPSGGEAHLLLGHEGPVRAVAFSPDGRWLASGGFDGTIRLWASPDVTEIPIHERGLDEILSTLRAATNLRAVPDDESSTGWKLEFGPFPGWARLPEW
jgi:WD40 repeat protein